MNFDSSIMDFCIGMTFFYVILSLICTTINEFLMDKWHQLRQRTLLEGISGLFYDAGRVADIYKHPLIRGLYQDQDVPVGAKTTGPEKPEPVSGTEKEELDKCMNLFGKDVLKKLPSYIPSRTFATALIDVLANHKPVQDFAQLRATVAAIDNDRIKNALLPLIDSANQKVEKAMENIEKWYDDSMDRVSGWFKRKAKQWLILIAAAVCIIVNADSITVGKILWQDKTVRAGFAAQAEKYKPKSSTERDYAGEIKKDVDTLSPFPLGWTMPAKGSFCLTGLLKWEPGPDNSRNPREVPTDLSSLLLKMIGLFFTTLAISMGAPFWADLLNNIVNLRRTGKVPARAGTGGK